MVTRNILVFVLKKMSKSCSTHGNKKHMLVIVLQKMSKSCSAHGNKKHVTLIDHVVFRHGRLSVLYVGCPSLKLQPADLSQFKCPTHTAAHSPTANAINASNYVKHALLYVCNSTLLTNHSVILPCTIESQPLMV